VENTHGAGELTIPVAVPIWSVNGSSNETEQKLFPIFDELMLRLVNEEKVIEARIRFSVPCWISGFIEPDIYFAPMPRIEQHQY
jgi:hypothetical protein